MPSRTGIALGKMNYKQKRYCDAVSLMLAMAKNRNDKEDIGFQKGKLRGFLDGLCQSGAINGTDTKLLFLFYNSEERKTADKE